MGLSKLRMPPEVRTIGKPEGGWKPGTYLVNVSFQTGNPIHPAILCVKFMRKGRPVNECLWNPTWEREHTMSDLHYLEVVSRSEEFSKAFEQCFCS